MPLELWLFAVVMEVIVIGTFFGGTFLAYRAGKRTSLRAGDAVETRVTSALRHEGPSGRPAKSHEISTRRPAA